MSYYNQPFLDWARSANTKLATKYKISASQYKIGAIQYKIDDQFQNWHTKYKNGDQTEKWHKPIKTTLVSKLVQAIFLPGAWGKIPVFMGKNHPTPRAAMAFLMLKTTPPFLHVEKIF